MAIEMAMLLYCSFLARDGNVSDCRTPPMRILFGDFGSRRRE